MTSITEWLARQKALLSAATPGPWPISDLKTSLDEALKNATTGTGISLIQSNYEQAVKDQKFIASVRTEHERALKIIEKYREALEHYNTPGIHERWRAEEALSYFPTSVETSVETEVDHDAK